ncbi:hypothetical protein U0035_07740 [Niabella yanshanensis]|uniref:Uncharacterized protein n=1 Tax=Niabella yanshanensis TaxID=577386 RepID=A0ABZ0WBU3_9BACT|nr:hypothetical protein [Niabella yanshanensis]WQD40034.1 hypothetical protein U0035_07740 [Niabella yanshanensis]
MNSPSNNSEFKSAFLAEVIFASLTEAGHVTNNIKVLNKGGFKKGFSNDVEQVFLEESDNQVFFEMILNRDGIYDLLPEGLFHQSKGNTRVNSVQDAVEEHKQFKEEEKLARRFFTPLEQLLFLYRAGAETAEREALYDIQNGQLNDSFYRFWNIDINLPGGPASRLLRLMPYADTIKSDRDATAAALSYVLQSQATLKASSLPDKYLLKQQNLNEQYLGVDATMGNTIGEWITQWTFTIWDIPGKDLVLYVDGGAHKKVTDRFIEIFVPVEIDVLFDFRQALDPETETYENILGVGAYL